MRGESRGERATYGLRQTLGRLVRGLAVVAMLTAGLVVLSAPAGAQKTDCDLTASDCSYLRLDKVPILTSNLPNGNCGFRDIDDEDLERGTSETATPPLSANVGDSVSFCFFVFNVPGTPDGIAGSGADATNVVIIDDMGTPDDASDDETVSLETIVSGNTATGGFSTTYNGGVITNTAVVTADNNFSQVDGVDTDTGTVQGGDVVNPAVLTITKTASTTPCPSGTPTLAVEIGVTVNFCYTVTNTGGAVATGVTVTDDNGTPADTADDVNITLTGADLPAGASATGTSTQVFAAAGVFTATANASGLTAVTAAATLTAAVAQPTTSVAPPTTVAPTTSVTVAGAIVNNAATLPFSGASDVLTSIWALGLLSSGLALVAGTRQRFAK